ncbi:MAG: 3-deoxy-7-phosphoheptulonate synthase, partial [Gammaproteobacteria bacterium]|nr:3-deoxy-7-phosphoheptulonate synthase [Gammaproteobacteria bacterium]
IGRVAGQYAKPRSQDIETRDGVTLPAYRGDIINAPEFSFAARQPDPQRMLDAYFYSAATLNHLRALADDGFSDLHYPEQWVLEFMHEDHAHQNYQAILHSITDAICFFESVAGIKNEALQRVALYTSHEALHLPYESALTKKMPQGQYYNLGTHFPWIGMRTLALEGAHIEYLRGIQNPIGIKVGPEADLDELLRIMDVLNPQRESGKIMLIHRSGASKVEARLPFLLKRIQAEGMPVLRTCDPMHGNTKTTKSGVKTRYFEEIVSELKSAFAIHHDLNIPLGGIHFEMTGENVTECIGGACGLSEADLPRAYKSLVDPRLNYQQAMEIALKIVDFV